MRPAHLFVSLLTIFSLFTVVDLRQGNLIILNWEVVDIDTIGESQCVYALARGRTKFYMVSENTGKMDITNVYAWISLPCGSKKIGDIYTVYK